MRDFGLSDPDICCAHTHTLTHTHTQPSGSYLLFCLRNCGLCVCVCVCVGWGWGGGAPETKTVLQLHSSSCVQAYIYKCVYVCFRSMTDLSAVHKHISSSSGVWRLRTHTQLTAESVYMRVCDYFREYESMCVCVCACMPEGLTSLSDGGVVVRGGSC